MHGLDFSTVGIAPIAPRPAQGANTSAVANPTKAEKDDEPDFFSFDSLLDIVNPLQHLPIVGTLYRAITGDKMNVGAKLAGDGLYGGFTGLIGSVADTLFEKITGKNVGDTVLAFLTGEDGPQSDTPADVAANTPPQPPQMTLLDASQFLPDNAALNLMLQNKDQGADVALRTRQAYARTQMLSAPAANILS